ncbi:UNVERIFIED_CONTAM: hypothetical protein K2H54_036840 [Gekko kuhli]
MLHLKYYNTELFITFVHFPFSGWQLETPKAKLRLHHLKFFCFYLKTVAKGIQFNWTNSARATLTLSPEHRNSIFPIVGEGKVPLLESQSNQTLGLRCSSPFPS